VILQAAPAENLERGSFGDQQVRGTLCFGFSTAFVTDSNRFTIIELGLNVLS